MNIVLYVEEAHNLIGKGADLTETWPRIAKEGAKAKILSFMQHGTLFSSPEHFGQHRKLVCNTS